MPKLGGDGEQKKSGKKNVNQKVVSLGNQPKRQESIILHVILVVPTQPLQILRRIFF